jgi:hypothetical protein
MPPAFGPGGPAIRVRRSDGVSYCVVRWLPSGAWTGTCEDYLFRHHDCKHIIKVRDRIIEGMPEEIKATLGVTD